MNALKKNLRLLLLGLRLEAKRQLEYKINIVFDLLLRLADTAVFFIFWAVILGTASNFAGWDFKGFLLIFAFEAFFITLVITFAYSFLRVNESIHKAEIDSHLAKPANTCILAMLKELGLIYSGILIGSAALLLAVIQGVQINPLTLAVAFAMIVLGGVITCLFGLSLATLSFWLGRIESMENVFESFWQFQGRPTNIFPIGLQALIAFTFPFIFIQTIPAQAILEKITTQQLFTALGLEVLIVAVWFFAFSILWNKGVKHYESGGG